MGEDYFAFLKSDEGDAEHHGVKGMKWGVIRDTATKARDHLRRKSKGEDTTPTKKAAAIEKKAESTTTKSEPHQVVGAASGETSSQRYARLTAQAREGRANDMSEMDLKFYNARTEALAKINKMNQTDPGWLSKTSKKVLQQATQKVMQDVADGVAGKYVTTPILDSVGAGKQSKKKD